MRALLTCLLLTGCAGYPHMEPGEPIVKPGVYKRTVEFHFYADEQQLQAAWRADSRVLPQRKQFLPAAYAFPTYNEVHTVIPKAGDPYRMCILGHELLHELTHAPQGQWHWPIFGGTECLEYQDK